jgi:wyosine [tRNA(Phe)-imidazoG37] synthetase (radical SAM superfamily)
MIKRILELLEQTNITNEEKEKIAEYLRVVDDDSIFLNALMLNGVDNWTWYDEAVKDYRKMKNEEEEED